jgi:hypothetical protein
MDNARAISLIRSGQSSQEFVERSPGGWSGKRAPTGFGLRRVKGVFEISAKVARNNDATKCVTDKADPGSDSLGSRRNKGGATKPSLLDNNLDQTG